MKKSIEAEILPKMLSISDDLDEICVLQNITAAFSRLLKERYMDTDISLLINKKVNIDPNIYLHSLIYSIDDYGGKLERMLNDLRQKIDDVCKAVIESNDKNTNNDKKAIFDTNNSNIIPYRLPKNIGKK